jgi:hypothetical protein
VLPFRVHEVHLVDVKRLKTFLFVHILLQQRPLFCAELFSEGANWAAISESIVFEYGKRIRLRAVTDAWMAGEALVGFG